ncbi:MAG: hypothetical protein WCE44_02675 [Candidatus Velthaea sp.]
MASIPGYHYVQTSEGALAIEVDHPYAGAITLTWRPAPHEPFAKADAVIPTTIFLDAVKRYLREQQDTSRARKTPATA